MSNWREDLLVDWRAVLDRVRRAAPDYSEIVVAPQSGKDGLVEDGNARSRAKCIFAAQYEPLRVSDPVWSELLRQEIAWHRRAPFQGYSDQLKLAAYLVALQPPEGVLALMWSAKTANFDTWCGLDSLFLGAGGVDAAIASATAAEPQDDSLLDHLVHEGNPRFSDHDVAEFLDELSQYFPADPSDEGPVVWFERTRLLGDLEAAEKALDAWTQSSEPPSDTALQYALASIGLFDQAAKVQARFIASFHGGQADPLAAIRLAELQRQAGTQMDALRSLKGARRSARRAGDPNGYLRRRIAEEGFLVAAASSGALARGAFKFADRVARDRSIRQVVSIAGTSTDEWLPFVVLQAGAVAAEKVGNRRREAVYRRRAAHERERIDSQRPPPREAN